MGRLLGGVADVSDTRVALACGTLPELLALPFWAPVLASMGSEIFTTERPPAAIGLWVFAGLQVLLWLWAWGLRVVCLAEAHDFSILRGVLTVLLSWLAGVVLVVGLVLGLAGMVGKLSGRRRYGRRRIDQRHCGSSFAKGLTLGLIVTDPSPPASRLPDDAFTDGRRSLGGRPASARLSRFARAARTRSVSSRSRSA